MRDLPIPVATANAVGDLDYRLPVQSRDKTQGGLRVVAVDSRTPVAAKCAERIRFAMLDSRLGCSAGREGQLTSTEPTWTTGPRPV